MKAVKFDSMIKEVWENTSLKPAIYKCEHGCEASSICNHLSRPTVVISGIEYKVEIPSETKVLLSSYRIERVVIFSKRSNLWNVSCQRSISCQRSAYHNDYIAIELPFLDLQDAYSILDELVSLFSPRNLPLFSPRDTARMTVEDGSVRNYNGDSNYRNTYSGEWTQR